MVQKQAAVSGGFRADQFAEDDPLAELARIVGFEQPRDGHRPEAEPKAPVVNPVFNLEDELLREFETFEAPVPRAEPVAASRPVMPAPVAAPVEPRFEQLAAEKAPAFDAPFDWADELAEAEFAAAAIPAAPVAERPVVAPVPVEPAVSRVEPPMARTEQAPAFEFSNDLADELDLAFGAAPERVVAEPSWTAPVAAPVVTAPPAVSVTPARISIPLANFQANPSARLEPGFQARPRSEAAPVVATPKPEPRVTLEEPLSDDDWLSSLDAAPAPAKKAVHVEPDLSALDNFASFSFTSDETFRQKQVAKVEPVAAEPDFEFSFADELAANDEVVAAEPVRPQPAMSAPVIRQQPDVEPVAVPVRAQFAEPLRSTQKIESAAPAAEDLLGDGDFELMLDDLDLDLDLSDVDFSEPQASAPVQARPAAPLAAAPVQVPPQPAATRVAIPVAAAAAAPSASFVAPATVAASAYGRGHAHDLDAPLPFDPEEIIEQEDQPESVAMVDVPEVAFIEEEKAPVRRPDFDYDLDTELAGLFENHASPAATTAPVVDFTPAAVAPKPASPLDDFDAFERALEEDFRRTLQTPSEVKARPAGQISLDAMEMEKDRARLPKSWLLAAGVAGAVLVIGGGAWALLGGSSSSSVASGEPVVIMADKDPVKVLPENPGGKTVPNQDKAVYDTVSGAGAAAPTQQSLISSNEEPIDVVQRTLMPDNLPLEDEGEDAGPMGTPVGETQDPRLLPSDRVTADAGNGADDSAIAPRKVRTMIVKPDGTLVAQEVPATAPMGNVQTLAANQPSALAPVTPAAQSSAPVDPVATPVATAPAAEIPAETETAAVAAPGMPVPVARPAAQPANVVARVSDQGNVSAPTPAEAAASTSVAAAPAQQPAAPQQPAAAQQASVPPGSYVIQIASLPSEADAQTSYRNLSNKFGSVIGGRGVDIKSADIPGKGTYYRVRIPAGTKAEAEQLCSRYKSAGGSCLVVR